MGNKKILNLIADFSSGKIGLDGINVFKPQELMPHGNPVEKTFHDIRVVPPLPGWLLISTKHCVTGNVHQTNGGGAAGDGDTNFELLFPRINGDTGALGDEVQKINAKIDRQNALLTGGPGESPPLIHIEDATQNHVSDEIVSIHCEVDPTDLETFKQDLAGMTVGDCYVICGQLVLDEGHGIYEIHPVQSIDKC
jgi:hypothetical protein